MVLAVITIALLGITLTCFLVGSVWLSKYAFRLGAGPGLGVLLFPPYTFYFAFYKLEQDGKDRPTALWMFGLVATLLLALIFQAVLRVPYFVEPTPEENAVLEVKAGETVSFDVAAFDLDTPSLKLELEGVSNMYNAKFEPGPDGKTGTFTWDTRLKDGGEYSSTLIVTDYVNPDVKRSLKVKVVCDEACKEKIKPPEPPKPPPSTGSDATGEGDEAGGTNGGTNGGGTNAGGEEGEEGAEKEGGEKEGAEDKKDEGDDASK